MDNHGVIHAPYAAAIATRFLERDGCDCEYPGPDCPQVGTTHYEYLTGDDSVVYEFPLINKQGKSGYIIVSGTRALPPILEFCPTGDSLRETLVASLAELAKHRELPPMPLNWRYFGPLDLVVELQRPRGGYYYARLPNLRVIELQDRIRVKAPEYHGSDEWLTNRWKYYDTENAPKGGLSCSRMFGVTTVRYNQTCQSSVTSKTGPNYCTPSCIVGCVATAWTVLAATWKSAAQWGSEKIFSDAPDWKKDWWYWQNGHPLPMSEVVNRRMWDVHGYMKTECNGNTADYHTIVGSQLFADYGVNWKWGARVGVDYGFASSINKAGQPGLLTAQSVWNPGEPPEGHGFVIHGWNDNDQHLFICLGWGGGYPDKWIAFSVLNSVNGFYVAQRVQSPSSDADYLTIPATLDEK